MESIHTLNVLHMLCGMEFASGLSQQQIMLFQSKLMRAIPSVLPLLRGRKNQLRLCRWPRNKRHDLIRIGREIVCHRFGVPVLKWFLTCGVTGSARYRVLKPLRLEGLLDVFLSGDTPLDLTTHIDSFFSDLRVSNGQDWVVWTEDPLEEYTDDAEYNQYMIAWCHRFGACLIHRPPEHRSPLLLEKGLYNVPRDVSRCLLFEQKKNSKKEGIIVRICKQFLYDIGMKSILGRHSGGPHATMRLQKHVDELHGSNDCSTRLGLRLNLLKYPVAYRCKTCPGMRGCPNRKAWKLSYCVLTTSFL